MNESINLNPNDEFISPCIVCCQINKHNKKTLPLICPRTNMPCLAFEPKYLMPQISEEMIEYLDSVNPNIDKEEPRVPMDSKYIDQNFIDTQCLYFDKLMKAGNKTILTLDAY